MSDNPQFRHYETIIDGYDAHYYDPWSMRYRDEFIYARLWAGLDLDGRRVAEIASGSGHNSLALMRAFPTARVEGFDISATACARYRAATGAAAHEVDLTRPMAPMAPFDAALVIGGLHHCIADLPRTLENIAGLLKPGGVLMMTEPNSRYALETVRRLWYRLDKTFEADSEAALDHDALAALATAWFEPIDVRYYGGPAYFAVLNSMILRIPVRAKPWLSPPLLAIERWWDRLPGKLPHDMFLARWRRR